MPNPSFPPLPAEAREPTDEARSEALGPKWAALQEAGAAVGALAGLAGEKPVPPVRDFPDAIAECGGWRLALAERGIGDLAAIMQPGLKALLAVHARGQDPTAAALTLWREFHAGRAALLHLVPQAAEAEAR